MILQLDPETLFGEAKCLSCGVEMGFALVGNIVDEKKVPSIIFLKVVYLHEVVSGGSDEV